MIRTRVNEIRETGRDTMGVQLINLGKRDAVVAIARNAEAEDDRDWKPRTTETGREHRERSSNPGPRPASSSTRDQVTEKMDKTAEANAGEGPRHRSTVARPRRGPMARYGRPKGRKSVTAIEDSREAGRAPRAAPPGGAGPRPLVARRPSSPRPAPAGARTRKAHARDSAPRPPRKAHLVLRRIEPWSAMKFSFVVSLVCFVVLSSRSRCCTWCCPGWGSSTTSSRRSTS